MAIEEISAAKLELEKEVEFLVRAFESATGTIVVGVDRSISLLTTEDNRKHIGAACTTVRVEVR